MKLFRKYGLFWRNSILQLIIWITLFFSATAQQEIQNLHSFSKKSWIKNSGQFNNQQILYRFQAANLVVDISENGLNFYELKAILKNGIDTPKLQVHRIDLVLDGITFSDKNIIESDPQLEEIRYIKNKATINITPYKKITVKDIYANIDFVLSCNDTSISYNFILNPGANPNLIKLVWKGCQGISIDDNEIMKINNSLIDLKASRAKKIENDKITNLVYIKQNDSTFTFNLGTNKILTPTIIDPLLTWSTPFNGRNEDILSAIDHDKFDNIFITGYSNSYDFPIVNAGTYFINNNYSSNIIVSKFSKKNTLLWSTYILTGNNSYSSGTAIKCLNNGDIFLGGFTNSLTFPTLNYPGAYLNTQLNLNSAPSNNSNFWHSYDGLIMRFDNTGNLKYSTYLGGSSNDYIKDIAINQNNEILFIGNTVSNDFPVQNSTGGYYQQNINGLSDGFLWILNNNNTLKYSSYFGGTANDYLIACNYDKNNNYYIGGETESDTLFPLLNNGTFFQSQKKGKTDGFITKLSNTNFILKSTYIGGSEDILHANSESFYDLAVDNNNNLITLMSTNANDFPTTNSLNTSAYYQNSLHQPNPNFTQWSDFTDYIISEFSPSGNLTYSTYFGGGAEDRIPSVLNSRLNYSFPIPNNDYIKIDQCNNKYFGLCTSSSDFPSARGSCTDYIDSNLNLNFNYFSILQARRNNFDLYILKLSPSNEIKWGTFWGTPISEYAPSISLNSNSDLIGVYNDFYSDFSSFQGQFVNYFPYLQQDSNSYFGQYLSLLPNLYKNNYSAIFRFNQYKSKQTYSSTLCNGICNGNIYLNLFSPCNNNPFKVSWNIGGSGLIKSNLCQGNYTAWIVDTNACTFDTLSINLQNGLNVTPIISNLSCPNHCDASASINLGSTTNYNVQWLVNDTVINNLTTMYGLCPGKDTVIVSINGCGVDTTEFIVKPVPPLHIFFKTSSIENFFQCPPMPGRAEVTVYGGRPPYNIFWTNGQQGAIANNIYPASQYFVIAIDSSACYSTYTNFTTPAFSPSKKTSIYGYNGNCYSGGTATIYNYYAGNTAVHYLWNTGDTTQTIDSLANGQYTCIVWDSCHRDTLHCSINNVNYAYGIYKRNSACSSDPCDGYYSFYSNPSYGTLYSINLQPFTAQDTYHLCYGAIWNFRAFFPCDSVILVFNVQAPPPPQLLGYSGITPIGCDTLSHDAIISINGVPPFQYAINTNPPQFGTILTNSFNISNLNNDSIYTLLLIDNCNDTIYQTIQSILPPNTLNIKGISTYGTCPGICLGTAVPNVEGGYPPFMYHWASAPNNTLNFLRNACPGSDTLIIQDACGAVDTSIFTIPLNINLSSGVQFSNDPCSNTCNLRAQIIINSGYPNFATYHWNNGYSGPLITNLCHNTTYSCIVNDSTCGSDTLFVTTGPSYTPPKDSFALLNSIICPNTCLGSAVNVMTGGMQPYHYFWSNGTSSSSISNLCAGQYYCFAYDQCASITYNTFTIDTFKNLKAMLNLNVYGCTNQCTNQEQVIVTGGIAPYSIQWSNGAFGTIDSNLCPGNYQIFISNPSCVSDTVLVNFNIPSSLAINTSILQNNDCYGACNGKAFLSYVNGQQPLSINWSNNSFGILDSNLCTGIYWVSVTDANSCVLKDTFQITEPSKLQDTAVVLDSHCQKNWGSIFDSAYGGTPPYIYMWNTGATTPRLTQLYGGIYILEIRDSNKCILHDTFTVKTDTFNIHTLSDTVIHSGNTVSLYVMGADSIIWLNTDHLNLNNPNKPTWKNCFGETICVIGYNKSGCADTACFEITFDDDCGKIECPKAFSPNADGYNDRFKPLTRCISTFELKIYDRWGNLVYSGSDQDNGWDGTFKNQTLPVDVFVWIISATTSSGNNLKLQGNLSLLR